MSDPSGGGLRPPAQPCDVIASHHIVVTINITSRRVFQPYGCLCCHKRTECDIPLSSFTVQHTTPCSDQTHPVGSLRTWRQGSTVMLRQRRGGITLGTALSDLLSPSPFTVESLRWHQFCLAGRQLFSIAAHKIESVILRASGVVPILRLMLLSGSAPTIRGVTNDNTTR